MIIHVDAKTDLSIVEEISKDLEAPYFVTDENFVLISSSKEKEVNSKYKEYVKEFFVFDDDIQLASSKYLKSKREVKIGDMIIGGNTNNTIMIAGPCSIESREQIVETAEFLKDQQICVLRAGSYKPRTSPYSFQGLGLEGLKLLAEIREQYGLLIITEVRDSTHVDEVIEYSDIVQIGAKAMYDHGIMRRCSEIKKPVLIKRGFGSTLQEFVQMAEFVLSGGNENVILCERGIRTFETKTRFTLDLCGVSFLKKYTNLPIILDPSHAMGHAYGVADLAKACVAMGIDGLMIETHPNPQEAKSDASQQLNHKEFVDMFDSLKPVAQAVGRNVV
ncbi:MAG: 3-deoxy-7-phosphoheptulonate synthase [bacterium]|nr:3-deoxy-7-phosphoheptulonate synthase [bacterium]